MKNFLLIAFIVLIGVGMYWYISHTYVFVREYSATVTVGGVVGLGKVTYHIGDKVWGTQSDEGVKIRIAGHSQRNEGEPSSASYQEFVLVPYEYLSKIKFAGIQF